jgi:hypothetical protein
MPERPFIDRSKDDEAWVVDHWLALSEELIQAGRRSSERASSATTGNGSPQTTQPAKAGSEAV